MLPKNFNEPMGAPAIFEKQIEIKLLHPASTPALLQLCSLPSRNLLLIAIENYLH
ncbi:MAG: hypothetical protein P8X79_22190 [Reinekea sp.]